MSRSPAGRHRQALRGGAQDIDPDLFSVFVAGGAQQEQQLIRVLVGAAELLGDGPRYLFEGHVLGDGAAQLIDGAHEAGFEEALLRGEVAVDQRDVDASVDGDVTHRGRGVPVAGEPASGGVEEQPLGGRGVPPPRTGRFAGVTGCADLRWSRRALHHVFPFVPLSVATR